MQGLAEMLSMGGYGGYVWAAFGFTIVVMTGLLWQSWRAQRRRAAELAELRSTIRGGSRPRRRLVATRPAAAPASDAVTAEQPISGS